jgi:exosortase K
MKKRLTWNRVAQAVVVLLCAFTLKLHYSTASADRLRWILAPTAVLVEMVSGTAFEFESHAGYISADRRFLIAPACAGVNFLITAFLMLSIRKLWGARSKTSAWAFIPAAFAIAYAVTLVANTVRISIALQMQRLPAEISGLNHDQLHRFEGVFIYFGFLLLLFIISERTSSETAGNLSRQLCFPLLVYYATALGMPLANGAYRQGLDFWKHSLFVFLIPPLLIVPFATYIFLSSRTNCRDALRKLTWRWLPSGGKSKTS